jgi:heme-degrading monooxygenase HmoA
MYVRANQVSVDPSRVDDLIRFVADEVLPVSRQQRDTRGLAMGIDRETGRCSIVSFWDDLDAVRASESNVAMLRDEAAKRFGATFDVMVLEEVETRMVEPPEAGCWNRVSLLDVDPSAIDAATDAFRVSTLPALEAMTGFCAAVMCVDREHGRAVAVTTWRDHDALRSGTERANSLREEIRDKAQGTIIAVFEEEIAISAQMD